MEIKPDTPSPDHDAMATGWETANDLTDGAKAVRNRGQKYLPKFPNESQKDYDFRRETAKYTNVYRDIVEGLSAKPFAKEVAVGEETPERITDLVEDIDGRGNHLHVFASETFFNGINKALDWILVDFTKAEGLRTVEDERLAGVRPYWVHIPAEKVIWIESEFIKGREQLSRVRILESEGRVKEFVRTQIENERGESVDTVVWQIWQKTDADSEWLISDFGTITIGVIPMVPFATGRRKGASWQFWPPMADAADLQIELYQQETALKYAKTMSAFAMLSGNGVEPDREADGTPKRVPVGPAGVLYAPPNSDGSHGEWSWISPQAEILQFLAKDIEDTIKELREIGRQPLTAQSGNLTVISTAFAAAKGNSAVQAWALGLKDALENAFKLTAMWLGVEFEAEVKVHTDFGVEDLDNKAFDQLIELRKPAQDGERDLSLETLFEEGKRRGILSAEFDTEQEVERLLGEIPGGE